jgi:NTE family protein
LALYGPVEILQELMTSPRYRAATGVDRVRRIAIVIVNARSAPGFDWDQVPYGPGALGLLAQSISVPINHYSTEAIAALQDVVSIWQLQARLDADAKRADALPAVEFSIVDVSFDAVADPALREYLQNLPTTFALSDEAVDRARAAAAQVLRESAAFQRFVASLSRPQ